MTGFWRAQHVDHTASRSEAAQPHPANCSALVIALGRQPPAARREDHHANHLPRGSRGLAHRPRRHGHVRELTAPSPTRRSPSAPSTGPSTSASPSSTPPRSTARTTTRSSSAGPSRTAATRSCSPPSSASSPTPGGAGQSRQHPGQHPDRRRGLAGEARHRPHRPVLPAPRRPEHAHRGDGRRPGRAGRRGQDPPHRPVRGLGRHHPSRSRRAPHHRAAVGVLAVDP